MKRISEWALERVGFGKNTINAIAMLDGEQSDKLVEVIVGCEISDNELPKEVVCEGKVFRFVRSNYVHDRIIYTSEDTDHRYFSNQEDADRYAESGYYTWGSSSSSASDNYPIKGSWTRPCEHMTFYEQWFSWANKSK